MEEDWRGHAVQGVRTGGKGQSQRGEGCAANLEPAGSQMRELSLFLHMLLYGLRKVSKR